MTKFSKNRKPRRRVPRRRREHLLNVTATAETTRRRRKQKILVHAIEAGIAAVLLTAAYLGVRALLDAQVFRNPQYSVRVVEVNSDGVMSREEALSKSGIREGLNIFSLNLQSAQRALAAIPEVKEAKVERILPDTVTIDLSARRPVAWVAPRETGTDPSTMESACLVDSAGIMMKPQGSSANYASLPVVYGVPTEQWRPGDKIDMPELRAALELFSRAADYTNPEITLRAADISKGWCVQAWSDPQTRFTFGLTDLSSQLDRLRLIVAHVGQMSRKIATANLIPERNTPVTFQDSPPAAAAAPAAAPAKKAKP